MQGGYVAFFVFIIFSYANSIPAAAGEPLLPIDCFDVKLITILGEKRLYRTFFIQKWFKPKSRKTFSTFKFGIGIISGLDEEILEKAEEAVLGFIRRLDKGPLEDISKNKHIFKQHIVDILLNADIISQEQTNRFGLNYYMYSHTKKNYDNVPDALILPEEMEELMRITNTSDKPTEDKDLQKEFVELRAFTEQLCEGTSLFHKAIVLIPKRDAFITYIKQCFALPRSKRPSS